MLNFIIENIVILYQSAVIAHHVSFDSGFYWWQGVTGRSGNDHIEAKMIEILDR